MSWRLARSLEVLSAEIKSKYPNTTIWTIGDESHQSGWSDHNPNDDNVVCAIDVNGDGGLDLGEFVERLLSRPHVNLRYVIFNRKIYQRKNGFDQQDYNGVNAHKTHVHASVGNGPDGRSEYNYDSTQAWGIGDESPAPKPKPPVSGGWTDKLMSDLPMLKRGSKGAYVKRAQALLNTYGAGLKEDGYFGPNTGREVRDFQRRFGLVVDEHVGKNTWSKLVKG